MLCLFMLLMCETTVKNKQKLYYKKSIILTHIEVYGPIELEELLTQPLILWGCPSRAGLSFRSMIIVRTKVYIYVSNLSIN